MEKNVPRERTRKWTRGYHSPSVRTLRAMKVCIPSYRVPGPGPNFTNVNSSVGSAQEKHVSSFSFPLLLPPSPRVFRFDDLLGISSQNEIYPIPVPTSNVGNAWSVDYLNIFISRTFIDLRVSLFSSVRDQTDEMEAMYDMKFLLVKQMERRSML